MDAKTIAEITSESPAEQNQRAQLDLKKQRLQKGLAVCRNALSGFKSFGR